VAEPGHERRPDAEPRILFADEAIVVVDKPPGMPSVPARNPADPPDVARRLCGMLPGSDGRPEAVHRLDRDTSGLLLLARSTAARAALGRAFERGLVEKRYLALVHGAPPAPAGLIHLPIAPDPLRPPAQRPCATVGRRATSRWITVSAEGLAEGVTMLELEPVTGRSHQLRVHMAWLGCPVLGDRLYGDAARWQGDRLWLHAARIAFPHPRDGRRMAFLAPLCLDRHAGPGGGGRTLGHPAPPLGSGG
jgi:tRNA pseudouridine32 synthase/23S rRNA pseudouridine746 synthase